MHLYDAKRNEWHCKIDNRWSSFLYACGLVPLLLPNDSLVAAQLLEELNPIGLVLSGGGECVALSGIADPRDETEQAALAWATRHSKPILGVCRGMQVLLASYGAKLLPVQNHVRCKHDLIFANGIRQVNSFHDYGVYTAPGFEVLGHTEDGLIEWIHHKTDLLTGIMWHPERESSFAIEDIDIVKRTFEKGLK
jgi:putative glutamine amidotransferase